MNINPYSEQHSILARETDWVISHDFEDRPLISFCCGWTFSPGIAPSLQQPIDAAANFAEFILICHYLPTYHPHPACSHSLPKLTPPSSSTPAPLQLRESMRQKWQSLPGPPLLDSPFSAPPLLEGKDIHFCNQLKYTYLIVSFRLFNNFKFLYVCGSFLVSLAVLCWQLISHGAKTFPGSFSHGRHMGYTM